MVHTNNETACGQYFIPAAFMFIVLSPVKSKALSLITTWYNSDTCKPGVINGR